MSDQKTSERIGVLLVHGIGEQGQFEHLEGEVRRIISALERSPGVYRLKPSIRMAEANTFGAHFPAWSAEGGAPVSVQVWMASDRVVSIDFHEVWWADLDEPVTLRYHFRFWGWVLSMWAAGRYKDSDLRQALAAYKHWMRPPRTRSMAIQASDRLRLAGVGLAFLLILLTLTAVFTVISRLFRVSLKGPGILVSYLGDVKLYQDRKRSGKGPLEDIGLAPRVSIRRRMVRGIVRMATDGYDRWFVLAHSLGTVVAFNGLMEPAARLPAYLSGEEWKQCQAKGLVRAETPEDIQLAENLAPARPPWVGGQGIDRPKLFEGFAGLLTYGCPLEKFAMLWPAIVSVNKDESPYTSRSPSPEWINVLDPTDPVAGELKSFGTSGGSTGWGPRNLRYKAGLVHLLSHTRYLNEGGGKSLVDSVARWLLDPKSKFPDAPLTWRWKQGPLARVVWATLRIALWWVLGGFLVGVLAWVLGRISNSPVGTTAVVIVICSLALLFVMGLVKLIKRHWRLRRAAG